MSEQQQISKLAGALTEHQRYFSAMSTADRQWVIQNTEAAIGLFCEAVKNRRPGDPKQLLERLPAFGIPAIPQFVVADKLRIGETVDGIKVGWLGENLKKHFLSKREESVAAEQLATNKLLEGSKDPAIITALGGEEKVEVSFGQFWEFLKTADQNLWYVAYIRDTDGVLWAVGARWSSGGLRVEAFSLGSPNGWGAGFRFLSR